MVTYDQFTGALMEVDWMPGQDALAIFPEWTFAPVAGVVHAQNLAQVQAHYLRDVAFVVVPHTFASFVSSVVPMLQIKHFRQSAAGERELGVITYLVAEPHVVDVGSLRYKSPRPTGAGNIDESMEKCYVGVWL